MSALMQRYRAAVRQAGFRRGAKPRLEVDVKVLPFEPAGDPAAPQPGFGDSRRPAPPLRLERKARVTPVDQTRFGHGAGNCLAACVASLLDLPLDQLFDIPEDGSDPDYWGIVDRWLAGRGLGLAYVNFEGVPADTPPTSRATVRIPWGSHYMAWGPSARGLEHSVVYCRGQLAHDPHPDRSGLTQVNQVAFLVRLT